MKKKALLVFLVIFMCLFASCSFFDEMKGLSVYSDFLFSFQDYWEENSSDFVGVPDPDMVGADLYTVPIIGVNVTGNLGYTYTGVVTVSFFGQPKLIGEGEDTFFKFKAVLNVVSGEEGLAIGETDTMVIEAFCMGAGFILDGVVNLRYSNPDTYLTNYQAANLEGLWILLEKPVLADSPSISEPTA